MRKILSWLFGLVPRWRRWRFVSKTKFLARLVGADLTIDVAKSVRIGKGVTLKLEKGMPISITIKEGVTIEDHVEIVIRTAAGYSPELFIGPNSIIHTRAQLTVAGKLELIDFVEIGTGAVIRAAQAVQFGFNSGTGEYASVYDFMHAIPEDGSKTYQRTLVCLPVKIGRFVLIAAKATVNPGTVIGEMSVVFPHSAISGVHDEPFQVYAGLPAKPLNRPDLVPVTTNPMIQAAMTWQHGEPGPAFKTPEEALEMLPDPVRFDADKHGFEATMARMERIRDEAEQADAGIGADAEGAA